MKAYIKPCTKIGMRYGIKIVENMKEYVGTIIEIGKLRHGRVFQNNWCGTDWVWPVQACVVLDTPEKERIYSEYVKRTKDETT